MVIFIIIHSYICKQMTYKKEKFQRLFNLINHLNLNHQITYKIIANLPIYFSMCNVNNVIFYLLTEITLKENHNNSLSEFNDDEENYDGNSSVASELSSDDEAIDNNENESINGDKNEDESIIGDENETIDDEEDDENKAIDDEENNSMQGKNLCSGEPLTQYAETEVCIKCYFCDPILICNFFVILER